MERLDPALSRPGRMDVWIEFKNASKWQAEALFRNFFPSADKEDEIIEGDIEGIDFPSTPAPQSPVPSSTSSTLWSRSPSFSSSSVSLASSPKAPPRECIATREGWDTKDPVPAVEEHIAACEGTTKPFTAAQLSQLAKQFADAIPDEEFSVAALQGCKSILIFRATLSFSVRG